MGHRIPESFFIYQELVTKLANQKKALKQHYEAKIAQLDNEMIVLKEQIKVQNLMLSQSKDYIQQLEEKLAKTELTLAQKEIKS